MGAVKTIYRHIEQGTAGWFDFTHDPLSVGTDGLTMCVGVYFETYDEVTRTRGCVIAHVDSEAKGNIPKDEGNSRYQDVVADTENVKWGLLVPPGHEGVKDRLYVIANSDPGLGMAIRDGLHNKIGGVKPEIETRLGYCVKVRSGDGKLQIQYPPVWFAGKSDKRYEAVNVQGKVAWTNKI